MSADTRIVVIKMGSSAFMGVLQGSESLIDDDERACLEYACYHIEKVRKELSEEASTGLVFFATFDEALTAIPALEAKWDRLSVLEYRDPLVVEVDGGFVRKMRAIAYD